MQLIKRRSKRTKTGIPVIDNPSEMFKVTFNEGRTYTFIESKSGPEGAGNIAFSIFGNLAGPYFVEEAKNEEREYFLSQGVTEIRLH